MDTDRPNDTPLDAAEGVDDRANQLINELEDAKARTLRLMADFNNYQRRALQNEDNARREGAAGVVTAVVPVLDHFDHALALDPAKASADQVMAGVKVIRDELLKALAGRGVSLILPSPGDEFVPGRHEAVMQQPAPGVKPGRIVNTFQPGYVLIDVGQERVLRPAKVVVAP